MLTITVLLLVVVVLFCRKPGRTGQLFRNIFCDPLKAVTREKFVARTRTCLRPLQTPLVNTIRKTLITPTYHVHRCVFVRMKFYIPIMTLQVFFTEFLWRLYERPTNFYFRHFWH